MKKKVLINIIFFVKTFIAKNHFFLPLDSSVLSDSVSQLIQHSMVQYCTALKKSNLFDIQYITDESNSFIEKELYVPVPVPSICFISGLLNYTFRNVIE